MEKRADIHEDRTPLLEDSPLQRLTPEETDRIREAQQKQAQQKLAQAQASTAQEER